MAVRRFAYVLGSVFVAAFAAFGACTVDNPLYTPERDGGSGLIDFANRPPTDSAVTSVDLSTTTMTGCDSAQARGCSATGSVTCNGTSAEPDRTCPQGSMCASGYCEPPPLTATVPGRSCQVGDAASESFCVTQQSTTSSCQPFVTGADAVTWRCVHAVGAGFSTTPCTTGDECRSGFCGSNGTCFRACAGDNDCPSGPGKRICSEVEIIVEGQMVSAKSCIPG